MVSSFLVICLESNAYRNIIKRVEAAHGPSPFCAEGSPCAPGEQNALRRRPRNGKRRGQRRTPRPRWDRPSSGRASHGDAALPSAVPDPPPSAGGDDEAGSGLRSSEVAPAPSPTPEPRLGPRRGEGGRVQGLQFPSPLLSSIVWPFEPKAARGVG